LVKVNLRPKSSQESSKEELVQSSKTEAVEDLSTAETESLASSVLGGVAAELGDGDPTTPFEVIDGTKIPLDTGGEPTISPSATQEGSLKTTVPEVASNGEQNPTVVIKKSDEEVDDDDDEDGVEDDGDDEADTEEDDADETDIVSSDGNSTVPELNLPTVPPSVPTDAPVEKENLVPQNVPVSNPSSVPTAQTGVPVDQIKPIPSEYLRTVPVSKPPNVPITPTDVPVQFVNQTEPVTAEPGDEESKDSTLDLTSTLDSVHHSTDELEPEKTSSTEQPLSVSTPSFDSSTPAPDLPVQQNSMYPGLFPKTDFQAPLNTLPSPTDLTPPDGLEKTLPSDLTAPNESEINSESLNENSVHLVRDEQDIFDNLNGTVENNVSSDGNRVPRSTDAFQPPESQDQPSTTQIPDLSDSQPPVAPSSALQGQGSLPDDTEFKNPNTAPTTTLNNEATPSFDQETTPHFPHESIPSTPEYLNPTPSPYEPVQDHNQYSTEAPSESAPTTEAPTGNVYNYLGPKHNLHRFNNPDILHNTGASNEPVHIENKLPVSDEVPIANFGSSFDEPIVPDAEIKGSESSGLGVGSVETVSFDKPTVPEIESPGTESLSHGVDSVAPAIPRDVIDETATNTEEENKDELVESEGESEGFFSGIFSGFSGIFGSGESVVEDVQEVMPEIPDVDSSENNLQPEEKSFGVPPTYGKFL